MLNAVKSKKTLKQHRINPAPKKFGTGFLTAYCSLLTTEKNAPKGVFLTTDY